MYFGAQYYRPPFPPARDWERDIRRMKELHFNVVKLWAVWNWIEPKQGVFDFAELDSLVALCGKYGLKVIINTIPEGAPYWTEETCSDSLYETAEGLKLKYSGPANIPSAGWPGLCMDSPKARELVENFICRTAKHFATCETVISIDVWNEPHLEPMFDYSGQLLCYCKHSIDRFRTWLQERYGTLDTLNAAWFRRYTDWEQVNPPRRFGTYADMVDWRRFWLFNLADWMKCRADAARRGAPGKLIQSHVAFSGYMGANNQGGLGNELGDEFLLVRDLDVFGLSSFPLWLMGEEHVFGHLINAEIVAAAAGEKPFYQVELQGGAGKAGLLGGLLPSAEDVRLWNWSVIAAGGKGVVYWQYSPEPAGMESPGFGLIDSTGGDTPRLLSASKCAQEFDQEYLTESARALPVNGIYLSRTSDLITYAAQEEEKYNASFKGIYRILYDNGIPVRFIHSDTLEKAIQDGLRVLYLPITLALNEKEKELLLAFAQNGGRLILEGCTGMYGENGEMDMEYSFLRTALGMEHATVEGLKHGSMTAMTKDAGRFGCAYWRQTYATCAEDAEVTARFEDGTPAALKRAAGRGEMVWLAGFTGAHYNRTSDKDSGAFISGLFEKHGYEEFASLETNGLLVRLLKGKDAHYIVSVNHSDTEKVFIVRTISGETVTAKVQPKDGKITKVTI